MTIEQRLEKLKELEEIGLELDRAQKAYVISPFFIPREEAETLSDEDFNDKLFKLILAIGKVKSETMEAERRAMRNEVRKEMEAKEKKDYHTITELISTLEYKGIKTKAGKYVIEQLVSTVNLQEIKKLTEKYKDYLTENKK